MLVEILCLYSFKAKHSLFLFFQPLLGKCLFFLRTTDKAITTANVQQVSNLAWLSKLRQNKAAFH